MTVGEGDEQNWTREVNLPGVRGDILPAERGGGECRGHRRKEGISVLKRVG